LLTFAKPIEIRPQRFDLVLLFQECWDQIPKTTDRYYLKIQPTAFMVKADKDRIKQVMVNTLRNALEAMPTGGEVEIRLKEKNNKIYVSIGDRGTGISKKTLSQLFRPFFTTKSSGTGFGLVIAQSILQAHKGRIRLESRKPTGTWIRMEWPCL
jgi:signal transduction histidine kinase